MKLAEAFAKMPNLREINIASNNLGAHDGEEEYAVVASKRKLTSQLTIVALAEAFTKMPQLTSVNLADNFLTGSSGDDMRAVIKLAEAFTKMPSLRKVK